MPYIFSCNHNKIRRKHLQIKEAWKTFIKLQYFSSEMKGFTIFVHKMEPSSRMWGLNCPPKEGALMEEAWRMSLWFTEIFQFSIDKRNTIVVWHNDIQCLEGNRKWSKLCNEKLHLLHTRNNCPFLHEHQGKTLESILLSPEDLWTWFFFIQSVRDSSHN